MTSDAGMAVGDPLASSRTSRALIAAVRIAVAVLWIQNVGWKGPPTFGQDANPSGLYAFTKWAVEYPVFPVADPAGPRPGVGVMTGPSGLDRAVVVLGGASVVSAVFAFVSGDFEFVRVHGGAVAVALVLGLLACAGGWFANRFVALAAGVGFLVALPAPASA